MTERRTCLGCERILFEYEPELCWDCQRIEKYGEPEDIGCR